MEDPDADALVPIRGMKTQETATAEAVIHALREASEKQARVLSYEEIVARAWAHTKTVYVPAFLTDCAVWPLLQFINFGLPLRYQVLFVNVANLGWYTFLSFMAGGSH
jgi:hypothetical protein